MHAIRKSGNHKGIEAINLNESLSAGLKNHFIPVYRRMLLDECPKRRASAEAALERIKNELAYEELPSSTQDENEEEFHDEERRAA